MKKQLYIYSYEEYPKALYVDNQLKIVNNKEEEEKILKEEQNEPDNKHNNSKRSNKKSNGSNRGIGDGGKSD